MTYSVEFSDEAEMNAAEAGEYYDDKVIGLSFRFYDDLRDTIKSIVSNPYSFHIYPPIPGIRRCNLDIFPYAI